MVNTVHGGTFVETSLEDQRAVLRESGLHEALLALSSCGDRLLIHDGPRSFYFCVDPADIKRVFGAGERTHRKPLLEIMGPGLFSTDTSPAHQLMREAVLQTLTPARIDRFAETVEDLVGGYLACRLPSVRTAGELFQLCLDLASQLSATALFGATPPSDVLASIETLHDVMSAVLFASSSAEAGALKQRLALARERIRSFVNDCVTEDADGERSIIGSLAARLRVGAVEGADLNGEVLSLLGSGLMTTGATAFWALCEIFDSPKELERVRTAPYSEDADHNGGRILRNSAVGRAVTETLRLYPSGWAMFRTMPLPCDLGDGAVIPAGASVCVSPYVTQRTERIWRNATAFEPARFAAQGELTEALASCRLFPFASGGHRCVGELLALLELHTIVREVARRYVIRCDPLDAAARSTLGRIALEPKQAQRSLTVEPAR